jgi:hypothetical protein
MRLLAAAAALLVSLLSAPAHASLTEAELRPYATAAGLPADFRLEVDEAELNGYFTMGGITCSMFYCARYPPHIMVGAGGPLEYVLAILFHEIGHYHQVVEGARDDEWDADRRGISALCRAGFNGPEVMAAFLRAIAGDVIVDSRSHGNHYRRVDHARAQRCGGLPAENSAP